jgi:outer membrane receptor protein involved in Fe transport
MSLLNDIIKREGTAWQGQASIDGKEVVFNVNGGKGILWGSEGSLLLDLGNGLFATGHATYTWGEERISGNDRIPLTRIPPLFGQVKIRYDNLDIFGGKAFLEGYIRAAAKQNRLSREDIKDVRIPPGGTPSWWTLNFRAGTILMKHIRLTFSIENGLNKKYKYHASGIYSAGTNAIISLEVF